ncbi:sugar ABC transporter substrate-binding protein [Niallia sp. NCCP-28]|uniref:sugar ABC transporter substrate-binding protein n=1 Tax=Niallia sp. NCCP-28 TaxID=2934712 RepID=UPI00202B5F88|nr:substrate-binding domain-containing protein [Niallia sp. NCCP-28]GKU81978.1 D-xylose ABC transporter substrate-binding protein [Niallia sp. NCCP-28]
MKRNKNQINIFWIVILFLFITGCSSLSSNDSTKKEEAIKLISDEKKPYIGFILDTLKDERWYKDKELFEEEVKDLGGQVKTLAANGLDDVQIKQAELLIKEGVDVLVVVPHNADIASEIIDMAHKNKVKVISYDRLIKNSKVDYYISFDNVKVGQLQASELIKKKSKGNFAYIGGAESDNNALLFRQGAMKVLQPLIDKGDIRLVDDHYTEDWDPNIAKKNMKDALNKNNNKIDAVIAANDGIAEGVIESLNSAGLAKKVPVSGQDAELEAIRRIVKGTQTMSVYKPINLLATKSAEIAMKAATGEMIETDKKVNNGEIDVPSILLEPISVTKENIRETVIKDGYLTEKEVFE